MFDANDYLKKLAAGQNVDNPVLGFLGMTLKEKKPGYVCFSMKIRPEFKQAMGIMLGGLLVALADEAAAHAALTVLSPGESVTTLELKNDFLSMAESGTLTAETTVFKKSRQIIIVDTLVTDDQGRKLSRCSVTLMVLHQKP